MTLPKLSTPVFFLTLPSDGRKIKYRPFLVKEEKLLNMANEESDKDSDVMLEALINVVNDCTFGTLDIEKLPCFDFEYIFINMRAKSKGNIIPMVYTCDGIINQDGTPCLHKQDFSINLENIIVSSHNINHTKKLQLSGNIGMMMKYPTIRDIYNIQKTLAEKGVEGIYTTIKDYVECIYEDDKVYDDFSDEEFVEFLGDMDKKQFKMVEEFFDGIPSVKYETTIKCPKCGKTTSMTLEGLQSFLD